MYSFKCIASTNETNQMLDDISIFRVQFHTYQLKDVRFRVYTSLSNASVHCTFYIISWEEWQGEIVTEIVRAISLNEIPIALLFFNIPTLLSEDDLHSFTSIYDHAEAHSIPFIYKRKGREMEVRDETYFQLFCYFLHTLNEKRLQLEKDIATRNKNDTIEERIDNLYFLHQLRDEYCIHIHGRHKYNKLKKLYKTSFRAMIQYTNEFPSQIIEQDEIYKKMIRYHKELYGPFHKLK
jgi:hypothetical protein